MRLKDKSNMGNEIELPLGVDMVYLFEDGFVVPSFTAVHETHETHETHGYKGLSSYCNQHGVITSRFVAKDKDSFRKNYMQDPVDL
jgi:hypothetical protein